MISAKEPSPVSAVLGDDRDEGLAHQVAAEDERIDVVETRRVHELSERGL
jgi:hypothetical protein